MPPQTVLITGATDGIGLALARRYHGREARLILVGRRPLHDLIDPLFISDTYCQADLSHDGAAGTVIRWLDEHDIQRIDVLINNAGTGYYGSIAEQPAENIRTVVAVNLRAPIALTHALLPRVRSAAGQIVFISSVVSALPAPKYPVYAATKSALDGFVRNLRIELRDSGVFIQLIHPGGTRTGLHRKSGAPNSSRFPSSEDVAAQILDAIDARTPTTTIGRVNRLMQLAGRYVAWFVDGVMRTGSYFG